MKRYVVMHSSEPGFVDSISAKWWIDHQENPGEYRVVEILADPVTIMLADQTLKNATDLAYHDGYEQARAEIRRKLGL